jgi:hypothetical protein
LYKVGLLISSVGSVPLSNFMYTNSCRYLSWKIRQLGSTLL